MSTRHAGAQCSKALSLNRQFVPRTLTSRCNESRPQYALTGTGSLVPRETSVGPHLNSPPAVVESYDPNILMMRDWPAGRVVARVFDQEVNLTGA